jgi:hypothetical protein
VASQIVIEAKIGVFLHNPPNADILGYKSSYRVQVTLRRDRAGLFVAELGARYCPTQR